MRQLYLSLRVARRPPLVYFVLINTFGLTSHLYRVSLTLLSSQAEADSSYRCLMLLYVQRYLPTSACIQCTREIELWRQQRLATIRMRIKRNYKKRNSRARINLENFAYSMSFCDPNLRFCIGLLCKFIFRNFYDE